MFATSHGPRARRRGIVLVLVLGMLGLMALIGVTFATFAGQSLINSRNFSQGVARPQAEVLMDYALAQLINDTNNPLSALRGHSLLRDMYGNDSLFRGSNPAANPAADTKGLFSRVVANDGTPSTLHFVGASAHSTTNDTPFYNQIQYATNIPTGGQYYGLDFTRWIVRFGGIPNANAPQSFEILEDDFSTGYHIFTLSNNLANPTLDLSYTATNGANVTNATLSASDWTSFLYFDPNLGATVDSSNQPPTLVTKNFRNLAQEKNTASAGTAGTLSTTSPSNPFVLDGRYMRAFNGPGLTRLDSSATTLYPYNYAAYGNFRLNGLNPDAVGMDEDYDACDLENWYLAIQSADGQVVIPSFHRPGILTAADWLTNPGVGNPKILRPRQADNSPLFPADPSIVDAHGKLTYDVDNDGDGVTDSVWLDLGYPVQRDPGGKMYKPLFAFMVLGLNGRLPLNTVGNIQSRAIGAVTPANTPNLTQNAAGLPLGSTSQVAYPGYYTVDNTNHPVFNPSYSSETYLDAPLYDHTSHVGFSVNEINPKFALQNAPSNVYPSIHPTGTGTTPNVGGTQYSQYDNASVSVALTQLRNILAGTKPAATASQANGDANIVVSDGLSILFPNNVADPYDSTFTDGAGLVHVSRGTDSVAGRWGESQGVPSILDPPGVGTGAAYAGLNFPTLFYNNPVRAGRSIYNYGTTFNLSNDAVDDDFDATDPWIPAGYQNQVYTIESNLGNNITSATGTPYQLPYNFISMATANTAYNTFSRSYPETLDFVDGAGQYGIATERIRRYVTPHDPAGVGRLVSFMNRPDNDHDYGTGADSRGRMGYFRYFRPAGTPQEIRYPYTHDVTTTRFAYPFYDFDSTTPLNQYNGGGLGQQYLMPLMFPSGYHQTDGMFHTQSDRFNNRLHGFQAALTPALNSMSTPKVQAQTIASMAAMPRDWDYLAVDPTSGVPPAIPIGDQATATIIAPTINPNAPLLTKVNSEAGPNLGATGYGGMYQILYGASYGMNNNQPSGAPVVNGYLGGSLNKDEADEMNVYASTHFDMPYGPSDLEWLYRKQDVDGSTLSSRLSKLAPVSFGNPADGLTRRRMFSTDAFDLISFSYANDNPGQYAGAAYGASSDHNFTFNSRFAANASPSLEVMNQVVLAAVTTNGGDIYVSPNSYANFITTEFLPNVTLPPQSSFGNNINILVPNSSYSSSNPIGLPLALDTTATNVPQLFNGGFTNAHVDQSTGVIVPGGGKNGSIPLSTVQVQTPAVAHRDRKINLNAPLPISNDPAEPIRQKWCRETYQMMKAILPPASVDTPEELAALSQWVVNIIDFRDPDCTLTRFVNTDLEVTDVLTHTAANTATYPGSNRADLTWTVSVPGVKFAASTIPNPHFPYDPSLYQVDGDGNGHPSTTFLVQHGMEYNPIAINEALAYQAPYGSNTTPPTITATVLPNYQALFVELVNTLSEEQNNPGVTGTPSTTNSSAISLAGWDIVIAPDGYGWGRPDPISGDVSTVAWPPWIPNPSGGTGTPAASQRPNSGSMDPNLTNIVSSVQQYSFVSTNIISAMNSGTANSTPKYYVVGDYRPATGGGSLGGSTVEANPIANPLDAQLPATFQLPAPTTTQGEFYWVYLRRPANPFDNAPATQLKPNKEMVVVDCMRFPVINAGTASVISAPGSTPPVTISPKATNPVYSAQRLQPYRGGHLVRIDTMPPMGLPGSEQHIAGIDGDPTDPRISPANGATTICPPSPAYAYGYSEQMAAPGSSTSTGQYSYSTTANGATTTTSVATTNNYYQTINAATASPRDTNWAPFPFHDRDFASVAELLLVPGCPPGLFTKQFVEEKYPGNIYADTANPHTTVAAGTDRRDLANTVTVPVGTTNPSLVGRQNFNATGTVEIPSPSYPYLPDNFYYTAASVTPPPPPTGTTMNYNSAYTQLTTEIGGWTGAGWHKMMEFFEVPSSAYGSTGTTDTGNNFDWARADTKPGQLNVNLIIDEEVFAGLIDDPRLNEALAASTSTIPYVVSQIDGYGYPAHDSSSGSIIGRSPIFNQPSYNVSYVSGALTQVGPGAIPPQSPAYNFGRGYVYRDPNIANYDPTFLSNTPAVPAYQQVHGIKAAFSDFLKLRHGGSGYLFGYGAGPTGSGDFVTGPIDVTQNVTTHPLAAERPYRSLSFPDINYTILRPASLPPSPVDSTGNGRYVASTPPLPTIHDTIPKGSLLGMFQYQQDPNQIFPFTALNTLLAPMNESTDIYTSVSPPRDFPYVQDPGIKNPFLPIQFVNKYSPMNSTTSPPPGTPPPAPNPPLPPGPRYLGPPYAVLLPRPVSPSNPVIPYAPFPPPIPPTPARRLFQIPDVDQDAAPLGPDGVTPVLTTGYSSNASLFGQYDIATHIYVNTNIFNANVPSDHSLASEYTINKPTITLQLSTLPGETTYANLAANPNNAASPTQPGFSPLSTSGSISAVPPSLVDQTRAVFGPENYTPQLVTTVNNYLGAPRDATATTTDLRMHPAYRTEWLQKITNLTTVRTHQYAVWITVGFFEVVQTGTPELGIPDAVGQELGLAAGSNVRYRSFFVVDRTKATGFNPYYPGDFRDCLTYRRRIE